MNNTPCRSVWLDSFPRKQSQSDAVETPSISGALGPLTMGTGGKPSVPFGRVVLHAHNPPKCLLDASFQQLCCFRSIESVVSLLGICGDGSQHSRGTACSSYWP